MANRNGDFCLRIPEISLISSAALLIFPIIKSPQSTLSLCSSIESATLNCLDGTYYCTVYSLFKAISSDSVEFAMRRRNNEVLDIPIILIKTPSTSLTASIVTEALRIDHIEVEYRGR